MKPRTALLGEYNVEIGGVSGDVKNIIFLKLIHCFYSRKEKVLLSWVQVEGNQFEKLVSGASGLDFDSRQFLGLTERYPTHGNRNPLKSQTCVDYITL